MRSAALEAVLSEFSNLVVPATQLERPAVPTVPSGIAAVDELTGGLPRGCLTEICGPASSGRTTLLLSAFAVATKRGEVCALVDASDCFDPLSAQQAGMDLERLLWVRCGDEHPEKPHSAWSMRHETGSTRMNADLESEIGTQKSELEKRRRQKETRFINSGMKNCGSRGVHTQIYSGMPEIPEVNVLTRPEQRYRDISKLKQGDYSDPGRAGQSTLSISQRAEPVYVGKIPPKSERPNHGSSRVFTDEIAETFRRGSMRMNADFKPNKNRNSEIEPPPGTWNLEAGRKLSPAVRAELARVEQALKVTDLLLQSGGFGLIVLDLGNISVRIARRVPLTSWFRFRRVVENTATVLLILERQAHARSCASLVVQLSAKRHPAFLSHAANSEMETPSHVELLTGLDTHAEIARGERKSVASVRAEFTSQSAWSA